MWAAQRGETYFQFKKYGNSYQLVIRHNVNKTTGLEHWYAARDDYIIIFGPNINAYSICFMDAAFTVRRRIIVAPGMYLNSIVSVPDYTT